MIRLPTTKAILNVYQYDTKPKNRFIPNYYSDSIFMKVLYETSYDYHTCEHDESMISNK